MSPGWQLLHFLSKGSYFPSRFSYKIGLLKGIKICLGSIYCGVGELGSLVESSTVDVKATVL